MAPGLTDEQIATLRDQVVAGKSPRVRIAGSQFDGGAVRRVGDPAVDGDDYVTVRVKVDGVTDDLRFAPRELSVGRNAPAKRPAKKSTASSGSGAAAARRREVAPVARSTPDSAPGPRPAGPRRRAAAASGTAASGTAPKRGGRKATAGASVTITLKSAGTSWTVSVQRGAKSVAKNVDVNPGVVSAVAGLLQVPSLEEAVAAVNDAARVEAEVRAEELRAELARIQAVLDSHRLP